jgi:hypothetical protein
MMMALPRDATVNPLLLAGVRRVATRQRRPGQQPIEAIVLVVQPLPTGA